MFKLKKYLTEKAATYLFCCLYAFGILWFNLTLTRELFISIIPATLLMVITFALQFHKEWNLKTILVFTSIATSAFCLELIGVTTGFPFGNYQYDRGLGWMMAKTPFIIGLNWLFLVYASHAIASKFTDNRFIIITLGAALMLSYDLILESVAPSMEMWHFTSDYPPFKNFLSWFVVSLVYHTLLVINNIKVVNYPARMLFVIQLFFFGLIAIISNLSN